MKRDGWRMSLLLVLLVPLASAGASRFEGEVAVEALALRGDGAVTGAGALDLGVDGPVGLTLTWTRATGYRAMNNYTDVDGVPGLAGVHDPRVGREVLSFGEGRVERLTCHGICTVYLLTLGEADALTLHAPLDGAPDVLQEEREESVGGFGNGDGSFLHVVPAGAWRLGRGDAAGAVAGGEVVAALPPRVALVLENVTGRIVTTEGAQDLDVRRRVQENRVGPVTTRQEKGVFVFLELHGAALALAPDAAFDAYLVDPHALVQGTVAASDAAGWLSQDGRRRELRRSDLLLEGAVEVRPLPPDALLAPKEGTYGLSGTGTVVIDGLRREAILPERATTPAALAAWLLGALVILVRVLLPLYSRIDRAQAVAHPNRRRIMDALAASPGATLGELRRATGLARGVMEHHLCVLLMHNLVAVTWRGRERRYHRHDAPPRGLEARLVLEDVTRRRIARLLLAAPPLTQAEIANEAQVSRRLVSYHLSHLADVGLVEARPGIPKRYASTQELRIRLQE